MSEPPIALVTGATNGIGAAAAVELAGRGWHVLVHGRDRQQGAEVLRRARNAGGEADFLPADFASRDAVHGLATAVRDRTDRLDALVLNAGIAPEECRLVWDDVEETFAVNHLAPYLLTHDLVGILKRSAPARVVATSSTMHTRGELAFDGPADLGCREDQNTLDRYARSKLANLAFTMELANRLDDVSVTAFHPGFVPGSELYRHTGPLFRAAISVTRLLPFLGTSVDAAAESLAHLVDSDAVAGVTGTYFDGTEPAAPDPRVDEPDVRDAVWSVSASFAGVDTDWP